MGIYYGHGTSHSWTWFADIFDRRGFNNVVFLDEKGISDGTLQECDVLFISGGDTFGIAEGLGKSGAEALEVFVKGGGTYIGACAGAYLVLRSSMEPLNMFNFVQARITNLTKHLPPPRRRAEKYCTAYGCRYVYHPVRDEVCLNMRNAETGAVAAIKAPLYGGPGMYPSDDVEVLAEYTGFTDTTEYLIDEDIARETLIGNVAAVRKKWGDGVFYLFGPHFEHPDYGEANEILFGILEKARRLKGAPATGQATGEREVTRKQFRAFMSEISNARIVALAIERQPFSWVIGQKVYEPEKIRVFLETIWQRTRQMEASGSYTHIAEPDIRYLTETGSAIKDMVRKIRGSAAEPLQHSPDAELLFRSLREMTARFLSIYFRLRYDGFIVHERGTTCTYTSKQPQHCIPLQ